MYTSKHDFIYIYSGAKKRFQTVDRTISLLNGVDAWPFSALAKYAAFFQGRLQFDLAISYMICYIVCLHRNADYNEREK